METAEHMRISVPVGEFQNVLSRLTLEFGMQHDGKVRLGALLSRAFQALFPFEEKCFEVQEKRVEPV